MAIRADTAAFAPASMLPVMDTNGSNKLADQQHGQLTLVDVDDERGAWPAGGV
jgi:hypothetical protein